MQITNAYGLPMGDSENPPLMTHPRHGIPHVIDTSDELASAAKALATGTTPIALDVERAHGMRYTTNPYLIQIRREDVGTFLIDPVALPDLSCLIPGTSHTWLLHDGSQDLANLRFVGLKPDTLFDTMIAARLIGMRRFGLAAVSEQLLGLKIAKDHQNNDWSVRPLYSDWLRYAALDVELLTEIYRKQALRLHDLGRLEWAEQEFQAELNSQPPLPPAEPWRKGTGAGKLRQRRHLAIFRELWFTRERIARDLDIAPIRLVPNSDLIRAAQMMPRNRRTLLTIDSFRSPETRQFTDEWLHALQRARFLSDAELPDLQGHLPPGEIPPLSRWKNQHPDALQRLTLIREGVGEVAARLDLAPEVVLLPKAQRSLAWSPLPSMKSDAISCRMLSYVEERLRAAGARPWQIELCASPLRDALTR